MNSHAISVATPSALVRASATNFRHLLSRRSTRELDGEEHADLIEAQVKATRPVVSGVLFCGALLLALTGFFEMTGVAPSSGYPWWLVQLAAATSAGCALAVMRLTDWRLRLVLALTATLLIGVFMSMPLPGETGQLALRTGLFQLLPLALMALMVRPMSITAMAMLVLLLAYLRIAVYGVPGTGSALYWLYIFTTVGFGVVLAGYRTDFAVSVWRMRRRLMQQAYTDGLTGLANRAGWNDRAASAYEAVEDRETAIVFFDIDHFKRINDQHGHEGGDAVLQRLGGILKARLAEGDYAARIGGEEFAVLMVGENAASAQSFAERVRAEFSKGYGDIRSTVCAGISYRQPNDSLRAQMRRADEALYEAKEAGRDRLVVRG
jgi:diguanylate cyclase (GGDEF)-like protein